MMATSATSPIRAASLRDDDDDKLVVIPEGVMLTDAAIKAAVDFQERFFVSELVRAAASATDLTAKSSVVIRSLASAGHPVVRTTPRLYCRCGSSKTTPEVE
jgi:hypothetical protein